MVKEEKKIDFKCFSEKVTEVLDVYQRFSRAVFPFSLDLDKETLLNIGSGKAVSIEVTIFFFLMSVILVIELVKNLSKNVKATQEGLTKE